jgi:hypothetical protein
MLVGNLYQLLSVNTLVNELFQPHEQQRRWNPASIFNNQPANLFDNLIRRELCLGVPMLAQGRPWPREGFLALRPPGTVLGDLVGF